MLKAQLLNTSAKSNPRDRVLDEVEKKRLTVCQVKWGHSRCLPSKLCVQTQEDLMSFIAISLEFSLTYVLFRSMLFNLQVFGDFPALSLCYWFPVWFHLGLRVGIMWFIFFQICLGIFFWPRIWSVLLFGVMQSTDVNYIQLIMVLLSSSMSLPITCLLDLSISH